MYHRIAEPGIDPWGLSVTPKHFAEHLAVLKKHTQLISLRELAQALQSGECPDRAVAITFDDGYADNLYNAKPILDQYQIPATVFVTTGFTERQQEFWWDKLENICFQLEKLPDTFTLNINGKNERWALGEAVNYTVVEQQNHQTRAWEGSPGTRMYFYHSVWEKLQRLTDKARENALNEMAAWSDFQPKLRLKYRPMTPAELITLESSGWIEIGAHTVNHAVLASHPQTTQATEIAHSKAYLEQLLKHPVFTFSYPFGIYNRETVSLVKTMGLICACSTFETTVWKWTDRFRLPRFAVLDWDRKEFEQKILYWLQNQ